MTDTTSASTASQPSRDDLTPRIFRALYESFDLLTVGVIHILTPKGTPVFIGDSLGQIARQSATTSIRTRQHRHWTPRLLTPSPLAS